MHWAKVDCVDRPCRAVGRVIRYRRIMAVEHPSGVVARISLLSADEIAGRIVATDLAAYRDRMEYSGRRNGAASGRSAGSARTSGAVALRVGTRGATSRCL
jgi:ribosomal protein L35AE/L33A